MFAADVPRIGPYYIQERLGVGGMAETFVGSTSASGDADDRVCIKVVRRDRADDAKLLALFRDEARIHLLLDHDNVVRALSRGRDEHGEYLVLELVRGASLEALLALGREARIRLSHAVTAHLVGEILKGLAHAHERTLQGVPLRIIHRDVSPSNVLLSLDGAVKLADFGVAKSAVNARPTTMGRVRGKLLYLSPEQCRGEPLDARSDLFSVGVIAFELLTGQHPFVRGSDESEVPGISRLLENKREPVRAVARSVPAPLAELVERLLAPDPAGRPSSAAAALSALAACPLAGDERSELGKLVALCRDANREASGERDALHVASLPFAAAETHHHGPRPRAAFATPLFRAFRADELDDPKVLLAAVPAQARARGFLFDVVKNAFAKQRRDTSHLPFIPFHFYPQHLYLEALLEGARALSPGLPVGPALYALGCSVYPTFAANLIGRAIFAVGRPDFATFVKLAPRAYEAASGQARVEIKELAAGLAHVSLTGAWDYVPYTCGVWTGAMQVCRTVPRSLEVYTPTLDRIEMRIAW